MSIARFAGGLCRAAEGRTAVTPGGRVEEAVARERDALYRETLKRFGLTVLTPKARSYLDAAFERK